MEKYYITNCKSSYSAKNIEASSPKEAFLTVINYNKADEDHGIFVEECEVTDSKVQFLVSVRNKQSTPQLIHVAGFRLVRPILSDTYILRNILTNNLKTSALNKTCSIIKTKDGYIYYIPDNVETLDVSITRDFRILSIDTTASTIKVIGGRGLQHCIGIFKYLHAQCLDLTDFYAPYSYSWSTAFENIKLNNLLGLQRQSFDNTTRMERTFFKSTIPTLDLHDIDCSRVFTFDYCFFYSNINTLILDGIKVETVGRVIGLFKNAKILNGVNLCNITGAKYTRIRYNSMFDGLETPFVDISTWSMHKDNQSYNSMFYDNYIGELRTKPRSPFLKLYKQYNGNRGN